MVFQESNEQYGSVMPLGYCYHPDLYCFPITKHPEVVYPFYPYNFYTFYYLFKLLTGSANVKQMRLVFLSLSPVIFSNKKKQKNMRIK